MISLILGENTFENERQITQIIAAFDGTVERLDGETLDVKQLPDIFMGMSLFATKRLIIIKNLSVNKALWNALEEWIARLHDETHLVFVELKPDKRTKTFKSLQKAATAYESKLWTERDSTKAEQWVGEEATRLELTLDKKSVQKLVAWVGVDQWVLWQALQKLAVLDGVTPDIIEEVIEPNESENAFVLFEAVLASDGKRVAHMLQVLRKTEDPYRLFGLLSGQAFQLAALSVAAVPEAVIASDLGVHPFVVSKLQPFAKRQGRSGAQRIVAVFAEADKDLKSSGIEPWLLIERSLLKIAI
jgi:DNA polymerase-3 subunit delta